MVQDFSEIFIKTGRQGLYEFTSEVKERCSLASVRNGLVNLSILHTSASLLVQENADPDVQKDLINFFDKLVPMEINLYKHNTEGKDDMPAHIKSALTNNQISISLKNKQLVLGTWQALYLFEHKLGTGKRIINHHFIGEN